MPTNGTAKKKIKLVLKESPTRVTQKNSPSEKLKKKSPPKESTQKPSMPKPVRYNEEFIKVLGELHDVMIRKGEPFRARAYKKAQETIINFSEPITDPTKQLKNLPGIGSTILTKLEEYVKTGQIAALEKEKANPANILAEIYGVGPKKAKELAAAGITSINELRTHLELLNDTQKIGLKYYDDIQKRIPRDEIVEFDNLFNDIFQSVAPAGSKFEIVGSYRRGTKNSGDIDIIITNKDNNKGAFDKVLDVLIKDKVITEVLSRGKTKSLTLVQIKKDGPIRRVDFLYSPPNEYAFALFYFTGSKEFNTVVRQRALDLGYTLNEHGLSHIVKGVKGQIVDHVFPTEKSILNFLGLKYQKPQDRIDGRAVVLLKGSDDDNDDNDEDDEDDDDKDKDDDDEDKDDDDEDDDDKDKDKDDKDDKDKDKDDKDDKDKDDDEDDDDGHDDAAALAALESLPDTPEDKKDNVEDTDDKHDDAAALAALESLTAESPKKAKKIKKNVTLKKSLGLSVTELISKFKTTGIVALKMMTEAELSLVLHAANQAYYCEDNPILTDNQYDIIREYTLDKYPDNEEAKEGHTKCDVEVQKNKVKLPYELWSMNKIKPTTDALISWLKIYKGPYVLSAKLDGVSALYVAEDDKAPKLYTRGNGIYGHDISPLIPHLIRKNVSGVAVRGEIIVKKEIFEKKYSKKFSNPRNFVAGVVNKKTVDASVLNDLDFVPYELIKPVMKPSDQLKFLDTLWTTPNTPETVAYDVTDEISNEEFIQIAIGLA